MTSAFFNSVVSWMMRSVTPLVIVALGATSLAQPANAQQPGVFFEKYGGGSTIRPDGTSLACVTGSSVDELVQCFLELQNLDRCADNGRNEAIPGSAYLSYGPVYFTTGEVHQWGIKVACLEGPNPTPWPHSPGFPKGWTINLLRDGNECPTGYLLDTVNGECTSSFHLVPPVTQVKTVCDRTNPCNVATGNKLETEVDYAPVGNGGLSFARYYNSMGPYRSAEHFAHGWRHTYSRMLDERPDKYAFPSIAASGNQSAGYATEQEACETGWGDIKDTAWSGDLSTATAAFVGGNVCEISEGGSVRANFQIQSVQARSVFVAATTVRTISRPNGSVLYFKQIGSDWINELNSAYSLEVVGTDWVFTDPRDTRETYAANGQLKQIEYRNGQTETLDYNLSIAEGGDDNPATLDRVTGPFGDSITLSYNADGQLDTVVTPDGSIQYGYDGSGNLVSSTYPDLSVRYFLYEDPVLPNHLTGRIDENGDRVSTYDYDAFGRVTLSERADGKEQVQLAYNADGSTTLTMGNGAVRNYVFSTVQGERKPTMIVGDVCSICADGEISDRTYDSNGYVDEVIDWNGNVTQTVRNARGLVMSLVEAKGSTEQRTTTTTWHANYRIPTQIVSPKHTTNFMHDTNGNVLAMTVASGALIRDWTMTYNSDGQLLTIDGPRTDVMDVTTLTYHTCTTGGECGQLHTVTNALNQVTTYDIYDAAGRPTIIIDPNGLETALTYDWRGNVLTVVQTPTVGTARTTTMTYDDVGQLKTLTTPDGMVLTYTYSAAHYLTKVMDNLGNYIEYNYDSMGNLIDEDTYDAGAVLKRAMDYAYDLNSRLDTVTEGGFLSDLTIDSIGNLTNTMDPESASTTHHYDALNRLDQTLDALTGTISYGYDRHDNLISVATANGAMTAYAYDDLDNLTQEVSPDRGTTTYTYDEAGNRKTKTDARNKVTTYTYDALNRLTLVTLDDLSTIAYEYDVGTNAKGRLNEITDSSGTTTWSYDNFGAVTQKVQTIGPVALTTGYGYDIAGRLSTITYPSGKVATYGYNTYLPVSVSVDGTTILSGATYEPFGPVNGWTWGNASTASRDYDLRGLPTMISFAGTDQALGYDGVGQVTSQLDSFFNVAYDYDLLGRLTDFTNNNFVGGASPSGSMFSSAPVVLASIQTVANGSGAPPSSNPTPWITAAVRNVGAASVQLALGRAEVNTGSIAVAETVGYIAIESGASGTFSANGGTLSYEAQSTTDTVRGWDNGCYTTNFLSSFAALPTVIATVNRHDGGDGGWARRCSLTNAAVGLTIDEDQYREAERNHTTEAVGLVAFSQSFDATFNDGVSIWGMEADSVTLPAVTLSSNWVTVNFRQTYANAPVVAVLATNETADSTAIRIRNVTTTGFEAAQVEPANNDGVQGAMTMHYVAVEPGTHELPDGTRLLAATVSLTNQQHGSGVTGSESWFTETFAGWPGRVGSPLPATQVMAYDANGNRSHLTEDGVPYAYANLISSNRVLNTAGPRAKTYSYDLAGNITADGIHIYGYDDRGRLTDVDGGAATYMHNGQGERVKKDTGAVALFAYDEVGNLIGEYGSAGTAVQETVWFNGAPVAVLQGTDKYYVHTDHLGSPRAITDGNTVIWRWQSDPFGLTAPDQDPDGDLVPFTYNLRFPGQYYDAETGLHYNYYRTYDPSTGRYLESDPIGLDGGMNTYGYVGGNPLSAIDPYGLDCVAVGGTVTCTPGDGPTVSFPRPEGWPDTINSDSSNYHFYNIPVPLNGADAACVKDGIINNPTPGSPSPASPDGTRNNATPTNAQNLFNTIDLISSFGNDPGGYNNSPVRSYTRNNGNIVVNVTLPGHPLHPGYVVRTINGSQVNNYGEGTGFLQGPYSPVAGQINGVWNNQTQGIIDNCGCE